ncbi:MAG: hypothetical protein R2839_05850 [Thermomicrobiales bacterium]
MPSTTRRLIASLWERSIHKRAVEFLRMPSRFLAIFQNSFSHRGDGGPPEELAMTERLRNLTGRDLPW